MRVFFDNCVSPKIVQALTDLLVEQDEKPELVHLRDRFRPDTPDAEWLHELGEDGDWIIVSADPRISRGRPERDAWRESGLTAFFLGDPWSNRQLMDQAAALVKAWRAIIREAKNAKPGAGFSVDYTSGRVRSLWEADG